MSLHNLSYKCMTFFLGPEQRYDNTGYIRLHNKQEAVCSKPSACHYPNGISCYYFIFDHVSPERKDLVLSY